MDPRHELENIRRSVAMANPGQSALTREQALQVLEEVAELRRRLDRLRDGLRDLLEES